MDQAVGPVEVPVGHGILVMQAQAQATGGWMTVQRRLEVRRIVNLDAIGPRAYRDSVSGKLFILDLSKEAVFSSSYQPKEYTSSGTEATTSGDGTATFIHVSPADVVRLVDRNA